MSFHLDTIGANCGGAEFRRTHASIVKDPWKLKAAAGSFGTRTKSPAPSRLKAWATMPAAKPALPCRVPSLPPMMSNALPSAGHQFVIPAGGKTHVSAVAEVGANTKARRNNTAPKTTE